MLGATSNRDMPEVSIKVGVTPEHRCGYLEAQQERLLILLDRKMLNPGDYEGLLSVGFRRSGSDVYRPHCRACSACQSTLLLFLKRYSDKIFDYFPKGQEINIAIGKGHQDLPEGTLCIGNCTIKHKGKGIFVRGCPPVGSEILQAVTGEITDDIMDGHSETPG